MKSVIYDSIDAAIEDLTTNMLPMLRMAKAVADSGRGPRPSRKVYQDLCRLIPLLEDREGLRRRFEMHRRLDGKIEARLTPEAEALWRGDAK